MSHPRYVPGRILYIRFQPKICKTYAVHQTHLSLEIGRRLHERFEEMRGNTRRLSIRFSPFSAFDQVFFFFIWNQALELYNVSGLPCGGSQCSECEVTCGENHLKTKIFELCPKIEKYLPRSKIQLLQVRREELERRREPAGEQEVQTSTHNLVFLVIHTHFNSPEKISLFRSQLSICFPHRTISLDFI